jgi:hypothetical protein
MITENGKQEQPTEEQPMQEQVIAELARTYLGFDTLETRSRGALDFHEAAVWNVREALSEAYHAGMRAALEPNVVK